MKSNIRIVLFTLVILFLFSCMFMAFRNEAINHIEFNKEKLSQIEQSGSWNLIGTTISIDNNWTAVNTTYDWCTGEGTESEPYIIENITIAAQDSGNCIEIQNSNEYFIIQNCSLSNAGAGSYPNADITLHNVTNGKIINNYCYSNYNGICLVESNNNTVLGNTASNNIYYGIYMENSSYNTVSGNTASNNDNGIYMVYSSYNTISGNTASNNDNGIYMVYSSYNTISGNLMNLCGIFLTGSLGEMASNCIDDTNLVNNKPVYYYVNEVGLSSSNFTNAGQIILLDCTNSIISGLNLSYCFVGIYLSGSDNNTVTGNTASNNFCGIYIENSSYNTVSGNTVSNNTSTGIRLIYSVNNTVSGNTANANNYGIELAYSVNNTVSENTANNNDNGIYMVYSSYNTISENTANNNDNGIYMVYSRYNTISENTANNNDNGIYMVYSSYNTISENTISNNNEYGIYLNHSYNNTISENTVSNNNEYGIYLPFFSSYNTIFLNYFTNNGQNAFDKGTNNMWDNGSIGNYWDDYEGVDANNDGIGDTPYLIPGLAGSQDNFPIWNIQPSIPFGNYFIMFTIIAILSLTILEQQKKKCHLR